MRLQTVPGGWRPVLSAALKSDNNGMFTELQCSQPPEFKPNSGLTTLWGNVGSSVSMNCTAILFWDPSKEQCDTTLQWRKDGQPLSNHTLYMQNTSSWLCIATKIVHSCYTHTFEYGGNVGVLALLNRSPGAGQVVVTSLVVVTLREVEDFGLYSCTVRNVSSDFSLESSSKETK